MAVHPPNLLTRAWHVPGAVAVLALAAGLRWRATTIDGLWLDEIFSASYVNLGFAEVVVAVLRFDIHPPLYYLQLWLWARASNADAWLLMNSVFWSVLATGMVMVGVARYAPVGLAFLAGLLTAICGSEIFFASELRMYAWISFLTLAGWVALDDWVARGHRVAWLAAVALLFLLSASHSAAFVPIGALLTYLWLLVWLSPERAVRLRGAIGITLAAAAFLLPWLLNASFRSVSHTQAPSIEVMVSTVSGWLLGYFPDQAPWLVVVALLAVFSAVVSALLIGGRSRLVVLSFGLGPLLLVAAISLFVRPIWLDRTLAFVAPFIVIGVLLAAARTTARYRAVVLALFVIPQCLALLVSGGVWTGLHQSRKMEFREAASFVKAQNTANDDVYVPVNVRYWGIARYLIGPEWGSLLDVQDPARVDQSSTWKRIYERMGPDLLATLHLQPRTRFIDVAGARLWIGLSPLPLEVVERGYWFVGDMDDATKRSACPAGDERWRKIFRGVLVARCETGPGLGRST